MGSGGGVTDPSPTVTILAGDADPCAPHFLMDGFPSGEAIFYV